MIIGFVKLTGYEGSYSMNVSLEFRFVLKWNNLMIKVFKIRNLSFQACFLFGKMSLSFTNVSVAHFNWKVIKSKKNHLAEENLPQCKVANVGKMVANKSFKLSRILEQNWKKNCNMSNFTLVFFYFPYYQNLMILNYLIGLMKNTDC